LDIRYWGLDILETIWDQTFGWAQPFQFLDHGLLDVIVRELGGGEFAGGDVGVGDACFVALYHQGHQVIVALVFQQSRFHHRARRDHPGHLARHKAAHGLVAHLLHDGHFVPRLDELGQVAFEGVIGYPS